MVLETLLGQLNIMDRLGRERLNTLTSGIDILHRVGLRALEDQSRASVARVESAHDLQTSADKQMDDLLAREFQTRFPPYGLLSEERYKDGYRNESPNLWIIDPIDGSTGYRRGLPNWSITAALVEKGEVTMGMINIPAQNALYWAVAGNGAYKIDFKKNAIEQIRVSQKTNLEPIKNPPSDGAIFWVDQRVVRTEGKGEGLRGVSDIGTSGIDIVSLMNAIQTTIVTPSPSEFFAYLAEGRIDGFMQMQKPAWDFAAGILLVKEAGGSATTWENGDIFDYTGDSVNYVIADNGLLHNKIIPFIASNHIS